MSQGLDHWPEDRDERDLTGADRYKPNGIDDSGVDLTDPANADLIAGEDNADDDLAELLEDSDDYTAGNMYRILTEEDLEEDTQ